MYFYGKILQVVEIHGKTLKFFLASTLFSSPSNTAPPPPQLTTVKSNDQFPTPIPPAIPEDLFPRVSLPLASGTHSSECS